MTPCVSCRFERFVEVRLASFLFILLSLSITRVHLKTCEFVGVADGVADGIQFS